MRKNEKNIEEKDGGVEGEVSRINETQREQALHLPWSQKLVADTTHPALQPWSHCPEDWSQDPVTSQFIHGRSHCGPYHPSEHSEIMAMCLV